MKTPFPLPMICWLVMCFIAASSLHLWAQEPVPLCPSAYSGWHESGPFFVIKAIGANDAQVATEGSYVYVRPESGFDLWEIDRRGQLLQRVDKNGQYLVDGNCGLRNEMSSSAEELQAIQFRSFVINPECVPYEPQGSQFNGTADGTRLNLDGFVLARNYESHSMDGPEGAGHEDFASFSIAITGMEHMNQVMDRQKQLKHPSENRQLQVSDLLGNDLQFSKEEMWHFTRRKVAYFLRENKQLRDKTFGFQLGGPYLNEKLKAPLTSPRYWHGINDRLQGRTPNQCEWYGDMQTSAQVVSFVPRLYPLVNLDQLGQTLPHETHWVLALRDGDGSINVSHQKQESADDMMGVFIVSNDDLVAGKALLYRQINSLGATDWVIQLSVRK